jgi:hypothetical protein
MATLGSFASGQVLTAAELNAIGTWQDYTPSFSGISVGNGTLTGRYCQINKFVAWQVELVVGSTTTISGTRVTYPVTASDTFVSGNGGQVTCEDASGIDYWGSLFRYSTLEANIYVGKADSTYLTFSSLSSTVPFTWASGDRLIIQDFYEAA